MFDETSTRAVSLKGTMRFSVGLLASCGALATAFVQQSSPLSTKKASVDVDRTTFISTPVVADEKFVSPVSSSALSMGFDLKDGQRSNMFDGPLPLTKERDACGVGFIANTQSGGKFRAHELHRQLLQKMSCQENFLQGFVIISSLNFYLAIFFAPFLH